MQISFCFYTHYLTLMQIMLWLHWGFCWPKGHRVLQTKSPAESLALGRNT